MFFLCVALNNPQHCSANFQRPACAGSRFFCLRLNIWWQKIGKVCGCKAVANYKIPACRKCLKAHGNNIPCSESNYRKQRIKAQPTG